jgi:hypothetical protein
MPQSPDNKRPSQNPESAAETRIDKAAIDNFIEILNAWRDTNSYANALTSLIRNFLANIARYRRELQEIDEGQVYSHDPADREYISEQLELALNTFYAAWNIEPAVKELIVKSMLAKHLAVESEEGNLLAVQYLAQLLPAEDFSDPIKRFEERLTTAKKRSSFDITF